MESIFSRNFFRPHSFWTLMRNGRLVGISFDICFPDSRGTHLSCIEAFGLYIDGRPMEEDCICFCLHDKIFKLPQLPELSNEYWTLQEWATIKVYAALEAGAHEIEIRYKYRVPFTGTLKDCVRENVQGKYAFDIRYAQQKSPAQNERIHLGVSLFSMGKDYAVQQRSLTDAIKMARNIGYSGFELVSAQMVPGYPAPSDPWCKKMAAFFSECGMEPVAYGSYVDTARFSDHNMTEEEIYQIVYSDMVIARKLGFKIVKVNDEIGCNVLKLLIPAAESMDLWIGVEFHRPNTLDNEKWSAYLHLFERTGSRQIGIVIDTGIFMAHPHSVFKREMLELGVEKAAYETALKIFEAKKDGADVDTLTGPDTYDGQVRFCLEKMREQFVPASMDDFRRLLKYCRYIHGKFMCLDNDREDLSIDFKRMIQIAGEEGFCGYINAEYEGYFHDLSLDTREQLTRYYRMMRRFLDENVNRFPKQKLFS